MDMRALLLLALLLLLLHLDGCRSQLGVSATPISLGAELSATRSETVSPGQMARFVLAQDASLQQCSEPVTTASGDVAQRYLNIELWNEEAFGSSRLGAANLAPRADPMLMVANSPEPPTAIYQTHQSDWSWSPPSTLTDYEGYRLMRPYQRVATQIPAGKIYSDPWYITVSNIDIWMSRELSYQLRVSCVVEPPCPSARPSETCSGHGQCSAGTCVCDTSNSEAWGDLACDVPVTQLQNDGKVTGAHSEGQWSFYVLKVPEGSDMLLVEMDRMKGDPVLFVKHQEDGFSAGSLPAVMDYESYADQDSFRSRLNFHHISIMFPKPGIYYVGVYNNDVYIKEQAIFSITARWSVAGNLQGGFCPADCNGHGKCLSVPTGPTCECNSNYGGNLCEGRHSLIKLGSEVIDELQPAQWAYYRLNLQDSNRKQWGDGLLVEFNTNMMGHPVLIVKRGGYPSMLNNDYIFTSSQMLQGRKRFKLEAADLGEGDYIFGIFNMDYYKHNKMEYTFLVSSNDKGGLMPFTPYMSIVLGVTVSLFLCLFMSICKRLIQRHGLFGHHLPEQSAQFANVGVRQEPWRGVRRDIVESFPSYEYVMPDNLDEEAKGEDFDSDGLPSCAVCLCSYENGEMMRKLPCEHEFHMKCIDQWLTQRTTCPMCRVALISENVRLGIPEESPTQGAVQPPTSPPGSTEDNTSPRGEQAAEEVVSLTGATSPPSESAPADAASTSSASGSSSPSASPATAPQLRQTEMVVISDLTSEDNAPATRQS